MKIERDRKNCYWNDDCGLDSVCKKCGMYEPLDNSDVEAEYEADLHMRAKEYQRHINKMKGNA